MKRARILLVPILAIILAVTVGQVDAQSPVSAEVDRTSLGTDELMTLTISIDASANVDSRPELPPLSGFEIVGSYSGTQMSIINGDISVQETYTYQLRPTQVGNLAIDSISVNVSGQTYRTEPIQIIVTQGTGVPQPANPMVPSMPSFPSFPSLPSIPELPSFSTSPVQPIDPSIVPDQLNGQDFYVDAVVDNLRPYQGQQVVYTLRFYRSVSLVGQANYQTPNFTGFWTHTHPDQSEFSFSKAGRNYQLTELKTLLFPTVVGEVTIDPASFSIPGGFFSQNQEILSNSIVLDVQPLPDGAPANFTGAVGQFDILSKVDHPETKVNDTVTWEVTISGQGNMDNLTDPVWPETSEWRAFDSEASVNTQIANDIFGGARTIERVLVPTISGVLSLPPVEFSYFFPDTAEYVTISSDPIAVKVGPDSGSSTPVSGSQPNSAPPSRVDQQVSVSEPSAGIQPNKPAVSTWAIGSPLVTDQSGYWLLWAAPMLLIAGQLGWQWRQRHRHETADIRRSHQAKKVAQSSLRKVKNNDSRKFETAGRILSDYISTRLNRSIVGLTQAQVSTLLLEKGIDPQLVDKVDHVLTLSDMGRYAPSSGGMDDEDIVSVVKHLIDDLDRSFRQQESNG